MRMKVRLGDASFFHNGSRFRADSHSARQLDGDVMMLKVDNHEFLLWFCVVSVSEYHPERTRRIYERFLLCFETKISRYARNDTRSVKGISEPQHDEFKD